MKPFKGFEAFFDAPRNVLYVGNGTHWYVYEETPLSIIDVFAEDLDNDYLSRKGLELMGITDPIERLKKHIMCKFGGSDLRADIDENGKSHPDSPECPKAKTCPAFSLCCKLTVVANGTLAPEETRITRLLTTGLLNKEIAHLLHKSVPTVNTQCRNIERKMGVGNKPELIIEAMRLGIVLFITNKMNKPLHIEIISFVKRVLKFRALLIENKQSKTNHLETLKILTSLSALLNAYHYASDELASSFLLKHADEIKYIMPGATSLAYAAFDKQLNELLEKAIHIANIDTNKLIKAND